MVVTCAIQKAQEAGQKNIAEMLIIIATLPVTSCEAGISFSWLWYLKTDLCSTMGQCETKHKLSFLALNSYNG